MARPQQRELARNEKVPDLSPDATETRLTGEPEPEESGRTGPVPDDNLPGHHPDEEQDKPDGAAFLARMQGQGRAKKAAGKKAATAQKASTAKKAKVAKVAKSAPAAAKAAAPVKKVGSPVEAPPQPERASVPAALADLPSGAARTTTTPAAASSATASTVSGGGGIDLQDVRDVALKLAFWPVTVGVWAGKQVLRRLQDR